MSEEELQTAALLPEGLYDYDVIKSEDKLNKKGTYYTACTLMVWDAEGKERMVFTNMAFIKLLKHFCDVNNMQNQYQSGTIQAEEFVGKNTGKVYIGIEGEKPKEGGGTYKAKNVVLDYIASPPGSLMKPLPEAKKDDFLNDDLPF
ncbi:MAG TPA: hypothetical protein VK622_07460 [Puia sp.]|nr:hypothetical protein [Puia sp.]